jgi:hypothetical protein
MLAHLQFVYAALFVANICFKKTFFSVSATALEAMAPV